MANKALGEREAEARGRAAELQAAMERGLGELRVGKEGLEVRVSSLVGVSGLQVGQFSENGNGNGIGNWYR